jgi:hypothetical protein
VVEVEVREEREEREEVLSEVEVGLGGVVGRVSAVAASVVVRSVSCDVESVVSPTTVVVSFGREVTVVVAASRVKVWTEVTTS